MKAFIFGAILLATSAEAQSMTKIQLAAGISIQSSLIRNLTYALSLTDKSECLTFHRLITDFVPLQNRLYIGFAPLDRDAITVKLYQAYNSSQDAIDNISKSIDNLCSPKQDQYSKVFVDIYRSLAEKDRQLSEFYLDSAGF